MSIEPNDQHARSDLATALRVLRKAAGLSGERLAARCAMSQSKISRIESGKTLPSVLDVERILHALEASSPLNTFVVYDDRLVIAELFSGEVVMRDHKDVLYHSDLFEFFYSRALTGDRARALLLAVRDEFM